jgi:hypothetical protein
MLAWWSAVSAWWWSLFDHKYGDQWISGITGAGGAILGGLVVLVVTAIITWLDKRKERKQKMAAAAFATLHKLTKIYSYSMTVRDHIYEGFEIAARTPNQPKCTKVQPIQRLSGPVEFSVEEHWSMVQAVSSDLHNQVNSLDDSFNLIMDTMELFGKERQRLWAGLNPIAADGLIGTVEFEGALPVKMQLEYAMLDNILNRTINIAVEVVDDAYKAVVMLVHADTKPLGKKFKIDIKNPQSEVVTISAKDAPKRKRKWWWSEDEPSATKVA